MSDQTSNGDCESVISRLARMAADGEKPAGQIEFEIEELLAAARREGRLAGELEMRRKCLMRDLGVHIEDVPLSPESTAELSRQLAQARLTEAEWWRLQFSAGQSSMEFLDERIALLESQLESDAKGSL